MGTPKKVTKLFLLAHKGLSKNKYNVFLFGSILFSWSIITVSLFSFTRIPSKESVLGIRIVKVQEAAELDLISPVADPAPIIPTLTPTIIPSPVPTATPKIVLTPTFIPSPSSPNPRQYTAEKINDVTWRVTNLENDDKMATAQEVVNALNEYRKANGKKELDVDEKLSDLALDRANFFAEEEDLDSHAGFRKFMDEDGFEKSGFNSLGENSAYASGPMSAEKIIKGLFGADESHDSNQLDTWTHVGIGVNGRAINVNFGREKK